MQDLLEQKGFALGSSGGGCEWYTKPITYKDKGAFVAITDEDGCGIPESLDEPILVGIYDMDSGDILLDARRHESLKDYLESGDYS